MVYKGRNDERFTMHRVNCKNTGTHLFSKDAKRRKLWEKALHRRNWKSSNFSRLCSDHFKPEDFHIKNSYTASLSTIHYRIIGYVFTIVLHVGNIFWMASYHQGDIMKNPTIEFFVDNQFRYITSWTFTIQVMHAVAGVVCDGLTLRNASKADYQLPRHLRNFRDKLFAAIVWPSSLFVCTMFWGMYHYDRNIIMPQILDSVLNMTQNHIIHTLIVPIAVWELYFQPRRVPSSHKANGLHLLFHVLLYYAVLFYTYVEKGMWIYPIFEELYGTIYFPVFLVFTLALFVVYYCIQWPLTKLLWGSFEINSEQVYVKAE